MAYKPGSYTWELREPHQRGEHAEGADDNCPASTSGAPWTSASSAHERGAEQ